VPPPSAHANPHANPMTRLVRTGFLREWVPCRPNLAPLLLQTLVCFRASSVCRGLSPMAPATITGVGWSCAIFKDVQISGTIGFLTT
jgi:hypothetical protein